MRKPQSQPSLAGLTEAEREQLADWVRREEYAVVRDRVNKPRPEGFGLDISEKPLRTLWAKVALLDLINSRLPHDKKLTLATFESLASRDIALLASANSEKIAGIHDTILNTVHDIATSGGNTPSQLLTLQRLADFPARAEIREQRFELDQQKFEHKQEMDTFRKDMAEKRFNLAEKTFAFRQQVHQDFLALADAKISALSPQLKALPQADQQGPFARTREDVRERVRIRIGISKEEAARRAALRKAHREEQAKLTGQAQPEPASDIGGAARAASGSFVETPCNADFQSAVLPNLTPNPSSTLGETNHANSSPEGRAMRVPLPLIPQNSPSAPRLSLIDFLKHLTTEIDTAAPMQNENCSMPNAQCNSSPNLNPNLPASPSSALSAPSALNSLPSLLDRVNQYNLARNREAEHGKNPHNVGKWNAWNFKSKMQFCPCGHAALPCPQHGWFPPEFFELSCDSADYWAVLDAKKLPYTALCHIDDAERDRLEKLQTLETAPP